MQAVNRKFYRTYVPTTLVIWPSETHSQGTQPINRKVRKQYFVVPAQRELSVLTINDGKHILTKQIATQYDPEHDDRSIHNFGSIINPCIVHCPIPNLLYFIGGVKTNSGDLSKDVFEFDLNPDRENPDIVTVEPMPYAL